MEVLGLVDIPTWLQWILVLVGLVSAYVISMSWNHGIFKKMGVDGPKPHLIFGNFKMLLKHGVVKTDENMYKKYGKVFGIHETYVPSLFIGDPELIKEILVKKFKSFPNRKNILDDFTDRTMSESMSILKNDRWRFVRGAISPTFSGKKLRQMTHLVNSSVDKLLENIERKVEVDEDIDMKKFVGRFTTDMVASTIFGLDVERQYDKEDSFTRHAQTLFTVDKLGSFVSIIYLARFLAWILLYINRYGKGSIQQKAFRFFLQTTEKAIEERRESLGKYSDFLGILVDSEAKKLEEKHDEAAGVRTEKEDNQTSPKQWTRKKLTDSEIISQALMLMFAGYHTITNQLCFILYHLAIYPDICDKLLQEIDENLNGEVPTYDTVGKLTYLEMCINETMRLFPAANRLTREASNDVTIGNINIPKGLVIHIPAGAIHKDPQYWSEPETFNPERFTPEAKASRIPFVFLPFGDGPRNCIGMRLALLELKIAVGRILQTYRPVKCSKTEVPIKISNLGNIPVGLFLKFEKRN
ncbi:cytochrome P450 3A24-like [Mizuhopecten yessoensis]|uniref:Cytochrome P450 3A24 n=1 Tax=Mizuhopecten yessoensis TaxID=6573 RepID=A0A210QMY4_MIZYE|nr:cytochrome P450 3A24-like [Mizuhopecten yessoensis]OWF50100.1 Cytochrome P450 3A24 [Mizuhopecten yessoensis]